MCVYICKFLFLSKYMYVLLEYFYGLALLATHSNVCIKYVMYNTNHTMYVIIG